MHFYRIYNSTEETYAIVAKFMKSSLESWILNMCKLAIIDLEV